MKQPVVLIGVGEMGGVFARALLRAGHPVIPVTRDYAMQDVAQAFPEPELVLISVAEKDLPQVLIELPEQWKHRAALLQNELLPKDWQKHGLDNPTVISVWFEKKPGQDVKVLIPSPAHGPRAALLVQALAGIGIPGNVVPTSADMLTELVLKNLYILTTNICGLETGGDVQDLWDNHRNLATSVANEVMDLQAWLTGETLDREALIKGMVNAFSGDPEHMCMGRSAPARLKRALDLASEANLGLPVTTDIAKRHLSA